MENIENSLKQLIQSKYRSLRDFSIKINMPYTTLDSIFKRGISNSSVSNVISICEALGISADALANGEIVDTKNPATISDDGIKLLNSDLYKLMSDLKPEEIPQARAFVQFLIDARNK